jgi:acyl-coenzyme A thioesterase PaaI-like protein
MTALDPELFGADQPCFGCSPSHPIGFHLRFVREPDDTVSTTFMPGENHQGPPGLMHGGLVMFLADEVAAWTLIGLRDRFGFTGAFEGRLKAPVRIGVEVFGRGRIKSESPRIVRIEVTLSQSGAEVFSGELTFAVLDVAAAEKLLGMPLPEAWKKFAR